MLPRTLRTFARRHDRRSLLAMGLAIVAVLLLLPSWTPPSARLHEEQGALPTSAAFPEPTAVTGHAGAAGGYLGVGNSFLQDRSIHSPPPTWSVAYQAILPPGTSALDGAFSWVDAGYEGAIAKITLSITDLQNGSSFQYLNGTTLALPEQWYNFSTSQIVPLNVSATYRVTLAGWCTLSATCLVGDGTTARRALFLAFNRSTDLEVNSSSLLVATVGSQGASSYNLPPGSSELDRISTWVNTLPLSGQPSGWALFVNMTLTDTTVAQVTWRGVHVVTGANAQDLVLRPFAPLRATDLYTLQLTADLVGAAAGTLPAYLGGGPHEAWNLSLAALPLLSLSTTSGALPLPVTVTSSSALISGPGAYVFRFYSDNGSSAGSSSAVGSGGQGALRYNWTGTFVPWEVLSANLSSAELSYWGTSSAPGPLAIDVVLPPPMVVRTSPSPPVGRGPLVVDLTAWVPPHGSSWYYTIDWGLGAPQLQNGSGNATQTYPASPLGTYTLQVEACVFVPAHAGGNVCVSAPSSLLVSTEVSPRILVGRPVTDAGVPVTFEPEAFGGVGTYTSFRWDFGDGLLAQGNQTQTHTYSVPGTYLVNLTVLDQAGDEGSFVLPYQVSPRLWANATALPLSGPAPLPVELHAGVSGGTSVVGPGFPPARSNVSEVWTFPGGTNASGPLLTHIFPYPGEVPVTLWVNDTGGTHLRRALNVTVTGDARPADWTTSRGPVSQTATSGAPGPTSTHILASAALGPSPVVGLAVLAPSATGGALVVAASNGSISALDPLTLSTLWRVSLSTYNEGIRSAPSVADGRVFVLGGSAALGRTTLFALNASTGTLDWQVQVDPSNWPYGLLGSPVPALGNVYLTTPDFLSAVNASTGATLWQEGLFGTLPNETLAYGDLYLFGQSPPTSWAPAAVNAFSVRSSGYPALPDGIDNGAWGIYSDGMVTLAGADGHLEGAVSGTPPWWDVPIGNATAPLLPAALSDGRVFATDGQGPLYAVSELNGSILWNSSAPALTAPVVGGSSVYAEVAQGSQDALSAFSAASGAVQWSLALALPLVTAPALCDGVLYAADTSGNLLAIGDAPLSVRASTSINRTSVGVPVDLHATVSGGSGAGSTVAWLFSDGTTAIGADVLHAFASAGPQWARAVVTDTAGAVSAPSTVDVEVVPLPLAPLVSLTSTLPGTIDVAWTSSSPTDFADYEVLVGVDGAPPTVNVTVTGPGQTHAIVAGLELDSDATVEVRVDTTTGGSNTSLPSFWHTPLVAPALQVQEAEGLPGVPSLTWSSLPVDHFGSWTVHLAVPTVGSSSVALGLPEGARAWTGSPLPNERTSTLTLTLSTTDGSSATSSPVAFTPQWSAPTPLVSPNGLSLSIDWGSSSLPSVVALEVCVAHHEGAFLGCTPQATTTGPGATTLTMPSAGLYDVWIQEASPDGFNVTGTTVSVEVPPSSGTTLLVVGVLAGAAVGLLVSLVLAWVLPPRNARRRHGPTVRLRERQASASARERH